MEENHKANKSTLRVLWTRLKHTPTEASVTSMSFKQAVEDNPLQTPLWAERDSNSHDRSRRILSAVRLPIPPSARGFSFLIILNWATL